MGKLGVGVGVPFFRPVLGSVPPEDIFPDLTELWTPRLGATWAYQDTGRTTLAAANGDRVASVTGWINSLHLEQATAGQRATLSTAGMNGYPCLTFDAVDDYLRSVVSATFNSVDGAWFIGVVLNTVTTAGRILAAMDSDTVGNDYDNINGFAFQDIGGLPRTLRVEHQVPDPSVLLSGHPTTNAWAAVLLDDNSGDTTLYSGGGSQTETGVSAGKFWPDRVFFNAGVSGGVAFFGSSSIQEAFVLNRAPTAGELLSALAWLDGGGWPTS